MVTAPAAGEYCGLPIVVTVGLAALGAVAIAVLALVL